MSKSATTRCVFLLISSFLVVTSGTRGVAQSTTSDDSSVPMPATTQVPALNSVGIDQHLNAAIPLRSRFVDEAGRTVQIGDYFGARPVVLILAYYGCPMLCSFVLNGA